MNIQRTATRMWLAAVAAAVMTPAATPQVPAPQASKPKPQPVQAAAVKAPDAPSIEARAKTEILRFHVNYPSGLSLGEGHMSSTRTADGWDLSVHVEAAVPAFAVIESAKSRTTADLCSLRFEKLAVRGKRKVEETTTFDTSAMTAVRRTGSGGGKSEIRTNACAKDAVAFIRFLRNELIAGRLPQAQPVYYGAAYQTRIQYAGTQTVQQEGDTVEVDKLAATVKGPASEFSIELMFAKDEARTPVRVVIPVKVGKFTVEFFR